MVGRSSGDRPGGSQRNTSRLPRPAIAWSPAGLAWIRDNDMRTVLLRHFPQLRPAMRGVDNAFAPWKRVTD